jgi:hypothetical protein
MNYNKDKYNWDKNLFFRGHNDAPETVCVNDKKEGLRTYRNNKSGFTGVSWSTQHRKWKVFYNSNKKRIYLGSYDTPEKGNTALMAYKKKLAGDSDS